MKLTKLSKIAASLVLVGAAAQAIAGPVYINRGASVFGDGKTGAFGELGLTGSLATSIYQPATPGGAIGPGAKIYDTNITSILNSFGVVGSTTGPSLGGPLVSIKDTPSAGQRNVDALNPLDPLSGDDVEGFAQGGGWGLSFNYYFTGGISAGGSPYFNGGYFDLFYVSPSDAANNGKQVLHLKVTGSEIAISNLDVLGTFTFDFNGDGDNTDANETADPFVAAFWNDVLSGKTFAQLEGEEATLKWALDTNVNPPIPTPNQLRPFVGTDGVLRYVRQTTLDSSIVFDVPEPATLSLLGLSLVGVAAASRRRKQ